MIWEQRETHCGVKKSKKSKRFSIWRRCAVTSWSLRPEQATGRSTWRRAEKVTVLDNSRSMIEKNRRRVQEAGLQGRVDYEETDLFCWHPRARYDAIFLGFWISHLPSVVLDSFLLLMASALKPGGCLAILEGQRNARLRSAAQGTYRLDDEIELRTLNDGRTFRIVKRYDDPEDLAERLERAGLDAQVSASGEQFLYALAFSPS